MKTLRFLLAMFMAIVCAPNMWATTTFRWMYLTSGYAYLRGVTTTDGIVNIPETIERDGTTYLVRGIWKGDVEIEDELNRDDWREVYFPRYFNDFDCLIFGSYNIPRMEKVTKDLSNLVKVEFASNSSLTEIGAETFSGCSNLQTVILPTGVVKLGDECFYDCHSLSSINLGNVQEIGDKAFWGCSALPTSLTLPSVTKLGASCFESCDYLQSVTLSNCKEIGDEAFSECTRLSSINLGSQMESIGKLALYRCNQLNSISLPSTMRFIDEKAFWSTNIKTIEILTNTIVPVHANFYPNASGVVVKVTAGTATTYKKLDGWSASAFKFYEYGEKTIRVQACPSNKPVEVWCSGNFLDTIPKTGGMVYVTVNMPVPEYEFELRVPTQYLKGDPLTDGKSPSWGWGIGLDEVNYPGYKFMRARRLEDFSFIDINFNPISEHIIQFDSDATKTICVANWDANGDGELSIEEAATVTTIGDVLSGSNITSFDEFRYFTGVDSLSSTFEFCSNLTSITLPEGLTLIGEKSFRKCYALKHIQISSTVTEIRENAFAECSSLATLHIPQNLTTIWSGAFNYCPSLMSISVDEANPRFDSRNGCNAIIYGANDYLIVGCKNTVIPDGVTSINPSAFAGNTALTSIEIPSTVNRVMSGAFWQCTNLKQVVAKWTTPPSITESSPFRGISDECVLVIPEGTRAAYIAAGWTEDVFQGGILEPASGSDLRKFVYNGTEAGGLYAELSNYSADQLKGIRKLVVNSPINSADLFIIRKLCGDYANDPTGYNDYGLDLLDLGNATIVADYGTGTVPYLNNSYIRVNGKIPNQMFFYCMNLSEVILPENVTMATSNNIFQGAKSDMVVHVLKTVPAELEIYDLDTPDPECMPFGNKVSDNSVANMTLVVPRGSLSAYQAAEGWNWFHEIREETDSEPEDMKGDMNEDDELTIADVTILVNKILGR